MYEVFNHLIHLDKLDLVGNMLLQISVRLGGVPTLLLIRKSIDNIIQSLRKTPYEDFYNEFNY